MRRIPRSFYHRDVVTVARALLGQRLVHIVNGKRLVGLIVETEAYLGIPDKAAHTFGGRRTPRNASMWGNGGHAYVYFTYGMHHCMNVVVGHADQPVAALIRALEPIEGIDDMYTRRTKARRNTDLCSGPAKLTQAFAINRDQDGCDLTTSNTLYLEQTRIRALPSSHIAVTPRIGIGYADDWVKKPLRFYIKGNPHVSRA